MPPLIAHFLSRSLEHRFMLETEPLRTFQSDWMNTGRPEVHQAMENYLEVLNAHLYIPTKEWARLLQQAVRHVTAYLVRPVDTLIDFVFCDEAENILPLYLVHRRMAYFAAYPYLYAAVQAYTERKHLPEIDRTRFASFLARMDQQMTEDHDADAWVRLLEPLFSLLRTAPVSTSPGIPAPLLQAFFEAKEARQPLERLAEARTHFFDETTLKRLLRDTPVPAPAPQATPQPAKAATTPAPKAEPVETQSETALPLWKRFQKQSTPAPDEKQITLKAAPVSDRQPPPLPATNDTEDTAVPLWMKFRAPAEGDGEEPDRLIPLERAVLGNGGHYNREWFTQHLFAGSAEAYKNSLQRLHDAATWPDASQIIAEDIFKKHQVNIYSPAAVSFTNAIETRYRDKLKVKG